MELSRPQSRPSLFFFPKTKLLRNKAEILCVVLGYLIVLLLKESVRLGVFCSFGKTLLMFISCLFPWDHIDVLVEGLRYAEGWFLLIFMVILRQS